VTRQLTLDLPRRTALGRSDFFVSDSNATAVGWIDRWPAWPCRAVVLHGAAGCGKTHLAHLWCERASAVLVAGATLGEEDVARRHLVSRSMMPIKPASWRSFTCTTRVSKTTAAC